MTKPILLIGYGNDLRSDDGAGRKVADSVAAWGLSQVETRSLHQLTPDLAPALSEVDLAIFVDAGAQPLKQVQVHALAPEDSGATTTHSANPGRLLFLAQTLYGRHPKAYWLVLPAENFELGETVSALAQRGIDEALNKVRELIATTS